MSQRKKRRLVSFLIRRVTSPMRVLPDFLIIGFHKCGTTSLYDHLCRHPHIAPAFNKEIHFFERRYLRGEYWYRAHFPTVFKKWVRQGHFLTGEASPGTVFNPRSAERVKRTVPGARMIVLMRNPVDRAFSHYQHNLRNPRAMKNELPTFEQAVEEDDARWAAELKGLEKEARKMDRRYLAFACLARGRYAEHLEPWLSAFPKDRFYFIKAEEMFERTEGIVSEALRFLGLSDLHQKEYPRLNEGRYAEKMRPDTRKKLLDYYRPHNEKLSRLLGRDFSWNE